MIPMTPNDLSGLKVTVIFEDNNFFQEILRKSCFWLGILLIIEIILRQPTIKSLIEKRRLVAKVVGQHSLSGQLLAADRTKQL